MKTTRNTSSAIFTIRRWQTGKRALFAPSGIVLFIMILFLTLSGQKSFGQGVGISEVSIVPDGSSILELRSTMRGFLAPRMTEDQRDDISSPAKGLIVYNTTTNKLNIFDGTFWRVLFSGNLGVNSITGTLNRISISGTSADPVIDIDANYIGQTSINTLGIITTGTWNADIIDVQHGGTGLSSGNSGGIPYFSSQQQWLLQQLYSQWCGYWRRRRIGPAYDFNWISRPGLTVKWHRSAGMEFAYLSWVARNSRSDFKVEWDE